MLHAVRAQLARIWILQGKMGSFTGLRIPVSGPRGFALLCLGLCLVLVIVDRWLVLHHFAFKYVDDDQSIMWYGAREMAQGRFHEPCFYGQRYNTMLEALIAVPLLWLGVSPAIALPVATSALILFPFLLVAFLLFRKGAEWQALIVLAFPVFLSPEFGMVSSMPRGFVGGIFLSSFSVLPLFSSRPGGFALATFFSGLALIVNPNAALVIIPVGVLALIRHRTDPRFYWSSIMGSLPALVIHLLVQRFYDVHPDHVVHQAWALTFDLADIQWSDIRYLDAISPVVWGQGAFVFVAGVALTILLVMYCRWDAVLGLVVGSVLIVLSFGINKVNDGTASVFYPWARMFLGVPFLFAVIVSRVPLPTFRGGLSSFMSITAAFFLYKGAVAGKVMEDRVMKDEQNVMEVRTVSDLTEHCLRVDQAARKHDVDLLIVSWGVNKHLTTYACPCLVSGFPMTMEPHLDRRTWWLRTVGAHVPRNVLFSGIEEKAIRSMSVPYASMVKVSDSPELFLLKDVRERTDSMLHHMGIGMRDH
ncbi:MAG: hypothetical protein JNJ91_08405 [Flavobacteriales bacterium]|nr:hypothetical protein [Flavobacteriales bacterium]